MNKKFIFTILALLVAISLLIIFSKAFLNANVLPSTKSKTINSNIIYNLNSQKGLNSFYSKDDQQNFRKQAYNITLYRGKSYRIEGVTDFGRYMNIDIFENSKKIESLACSYNAKCKIDITPENTFTAVILVTANTRSDSKMTLEVREINNSLFYNPPSKNHSDLNQSDFSFIDSDGDYRGHFNQLDTPTSGMRAGYQATFRIMLTAGESIFIKLIAPDIYKRVSILDPEMNDEIASSYGKDTAACLKLKIGESGVHLISLNLFHSDTIRAINYNLEIYRGEISDKKCDENG
ncbi:hypothetical protein [Pantoea rwandensis]|uniref:Uncharacterized protein n=1 Tax=Pantoea rwandensis TaxID=1076550 RepID=A0ABM5RK98_9GAMM|nr:hypothetical protein [Pantoea rwandensis]AIR86316.1 hypothetical protein LH22_12935 [Pantoea rwandensis]